MDRNSVKSGQEINKSKSKLDLAKELISDIEQGYFPINPCKTCHAPGCCGCPKAHEYENRLKPYKEALGDHAVDEAVVIGELEFSVRKAQEEIKQHQEEIKQHQEKLKLYTSSKYTKLRELKEEMTNLFGDFDE